MAMQTILVVFHLFLAMGLIGLVLMQHGKGADAGAAFGAGASGSVFGASGAANFLSRATAVIATLFFVTSLTLAWYAMQVTDQPGLMEDQEEASLPAAPVLEVPIPTGQPLTVPSEVPLIPSPIQSQGEPTSAE